MATFFSSYIPTNIFSKEKSVVFIWLLYRHCNRGNYSSAVAASFCRYDSFRKRLVGYI